MRINGTTLIDHKKRVKLTLSCDEFALAQTVEDLVQGNPFDTVAGYQEVYKVIGFTNIEYRSIGSILIQKGIFERLEDNNVRLTSSWGTNTDQEDDFLEFWEEYGKVGNKKSAKRNFLKAVKAVGLDHLKARWKAYRAHLEESGQSQLHMSTWLNPDNERWDDEYKSSSVKKIAKANEAETTISSK